MAAESCIRCRSNNTPRRSTRGKGSVMICENMRNCRRRQRKLYRLYRRTMHNTRGM